MELNKALNNPTYIAIINGILATIIGLQLYFLDKYNTFLIYKMSVVHFFDKTNLFVPYPEKYSDLFFYSPSFPIFFLPFAFLPTPLGLIAWVMFGMMVFYYALRLLPISRNNVIFLYFFSLIELVTSLQNLQTGPIIAACILLTFVYVDRNNFTRGSFFPIAGLFIKVYGAISISLFFLKNPKIKNFFELLIWFVGLLLLPMLYYGPSGWLALYQQWVDALKINYLTNGGVSIIGILGNVMELKINAIWVQLVGGGLFLLTMILITFRKNYEQVKFFFLAYILIWVVVFNHKAVSSSYIIAVTGVGLWYLFSGRSLLDKILLVFTFFFTILSPTDLMPRSITESLIVPYNLKAVGPSLILLKIQIELLIKKSVIHPIPIKTANG